MEIIDVPIYQQKVLAFDSFEELKEYCIDNDAVMDEELNHFLNCAQAMAGVLEYKDSEKPLDYIMAVDDTSLGSVSHEATHLTFYILNQVGVLFDVSNHEAFTYLQQYIFEQFLEKFNWVEKGS